MAVKITGNTFPVKEELKALGGKWNGAEKCWEVPEDKAEQARQLVKPTPIYNSPPPADLGTADPVELAAKFGRIAVAGAKVRSYTDRGRTPGPDGTVHTFKGPKRVVQVAHGAPRYYSRDMLEDFDMFGEEPGHQYQWDGVEVEPTEAERAEDQAKADAKADAERQRQEAADRAKAERAERCRIFDEAVQGLEVCTAGPVGSTDTGEVLVIDDRQRAVKILLADGRVGWRRSWQTSDDGRTYWHLPADAVRAAALAWAIEVGVTREEAAEWLTKYSGCHGAELYTIVAGIDDATAVELEAASARKAQAELEKRRAAERQSLDRLARMAVEDLGLLEPTDGYRKADWARNAGRRRFTPDMLASWEFRPGDGFEDYCVALEARGYGGDHPALAGAVVVLRLNPAAFQKPSPRSKKPAPVDLMPTEVKLHNFCAATVVTERAAP
jgi:hypothetical protein